MLLRFLSELLRFPHKFEQVFEDDSLEALSMIPPAPSILVHGNSSNVFTFGVFLVRESTYGPANGTAGRDRKR